MNYNIIFLDLESIIVFHTSTCLEKLVLRIQHESNCLEDADSIKCLGSDRRIHYINCFHVHYVAYHMYPQRDYDVSPV